MRIPVCAREADVVEAVVGGAWPSGAGRELVAHVESCAVCRDVVAVAQAMRDEHAAACQQAQVPSAGQVWWRAELRARQEAVRVASRPMTLVQVLAGACAVSALLTAAALISPWVRATILAIVATGRSTIQPELEQVVSAGAAVAQWGTPVILALGVWLILAPVALYVVLSRD